MAKKFQAKSKPKLNISQIKSIAKQCVVFAKNNILHLLILLSLVAVLTYLYRSYNSDEFVNVLTANSDLVSGQKLKAQDITNIKIPKNANINGVIPESNKEKVFSLFISNGIKKGDLILAHNLYKDEDGGSTNPDNDKKIYFLSSSDVEIIPFSTNPNDSISVFGIEPKTNKQEVILKQVRVLSVDKASRDKGKFPTFVSVELNDNEIFAINHALSNKWFLQMVLHP